MQDKHKVTFYLSPDLHRKLKIRAAVEAESMSTIAERALGFYLAHPDVVDEVEMAHGQSHLVYSCPECASSLVLREGEVVSVGEQPALLLDEAAPIDPVSSRSSSPDQRDEGELVPC